MVTSLLQSDADRVMALAAQGTQGVPDFFEAVDNGRSVLVRRFEMFLNCVF